MQERHVANWVDRYKIRSMRYDHNRMRGIGVENNSDMSDWGNATQNGKSQNSRDYQVVSPPSSRYGEDDASSTTQSRPRRSRLDNDIQEMPALYPRPQSSRKSIKNGNGPVARGIDPNMVNGRRSVGHNSTFNGYDLHASYSRSNYSMSGRYPPSSYASDYLKSRGGVALLPNKMMDPRRPRSTAAEKYSDNRHGFHDQSRAGYESYSTSGEERNGESGEDEEEEEDEEMRNYELQAQRAQGSRSVNTAMMSDPFMEGGEAYYFGVVHMALELVAHVKKTIPPPPEFYDLRPIERVAYICYCAVYRKPYSNIEEFHKIFNKEFYKFVCEGDSADLALFKICKSMQEQHQLKQLEESRKAYEKAQKEAAETAKLDFNKHRTEDNAENQATINQPEEVLNYGPLKFHTGHTFATFGIGGKLVCIRPAGSTDPITGQVYSTANVAVEDLRSMLVHDEQSSKVIELVQSFKGPLIPGQTPSHSVRLYIQRQVDALKAAEQSGDVRKSEIVDALLVWQLLEIMVQQHGRITGPDVATLLTNASEQLAERTGVAENPETLTSTVSTSASKLEAKERFNKFLLGGHVNEAIESAISDGLYADAMTLIRRIYPNDSKKIEDIESRFLHLRSVDDPYATLVAVASGQPPPILTNSAFDDDNNWKRHAAIILANLNSQTAMQTVYHLGIMLAKRERHCAADFCLLVVCVLAGYDPFIPLGHAEGEEKARKHIGLIHSGSHIINKVNGLSGIAGFSFTDLHATDIFDYALRLSNPQLDTPLSKSKEYQKCRIEYTKKISSYGGFATDSFRYCTEVARSLWPHVSMFDKEYLLDVCDLAENLQYVAAAPNTETEWIHSLRAMIGEQPTTNTEEQPMLNLTSEAQNWHEDHQTPIDFSRNVQESYQEEPESARETTTEEEDSVTLTESSVSTSAQEIAPPTIPPPSAPLPQPPINIASPPPPPPVVAAPPMPMPPSAPPPAVVRPPIEIPQKKPAPQIEVKSPRSELEDLWGSEPSSSPPPRMPVMSQPSSPQPPPPPQPLARPSPPAPSKAVPTTQPPTPAAVPKKQEEVKNAPNLGQDRKASSSRGWFGSIREKVIKSIPSNNAMILPDDSKPSITWDPVTKKYIGAGVEEEVVAPPPPSMLSAAIPQLGSDSAKSSTNSLRSARSGGGASRYLKATGIASGSEANGMMPPPPDMTPNMMPMPTSFGFIPAAVDDDNSYVDPFSSEPTNPTSPSSSSDQQNSVSSN